MTVIDTTPRTRRPATLTDRRRMPAHRPGREPVRYVRTGVAMSRAPHGRPPVAARPITPAATVALALVAAAITVWLGLVAHFGAAVTGGDARTGNAVPERLGVVQVHAGESLRQLAARVAPDAPAGAVAERIRELNRLDSANLDAGQTLITPIG